MLVAALTVHLRYDSAAFRLPAVTAKAHSHLGPPGE